ncbi:MAG: transposase [Pontiella sp.]
MNLTAENLKKLQAENKRLAVENRLLSQKIQFLLGKLFGKSFEKISPDQLALEFGVDSVAPDTPEAEAEVEEVAVPRKKRKHKPLAERIPEDLPVEEVVIEPEEVLAEPEAFKRIGEEVTEELDVIPTKFIKRRTVRPKYVRKADRSFPPVVAAAPKRIIDNSYASAGLLANIVLAKYADHLPLYRQSQINKTRFGGDISRQTMSDWMFRLAQMLAMIHEARHESPLAAQTLLEIQGLYQIEAELRANPKHDRRAVRQEKSLPILQRIGLQLQTEQAAHLPKSQTGKAIGYTLNLWDKLLVYTKHAPVEIDNNLVENAIRPTAIGKKNWLFFGSAEAGRTSAIHYTLLETCRKLGINPDEYLRDILPRLPHMTNHTAKNYTPSRWKAARENQ